MEPRASVRTCIGCGQRADRSELLRLRLGADRRVALDPAGRRPGRGAHVHRTRACLLAAGSARALGRAFRGKAVPGPEGDLVQQAAALGLAVS